MIGEIDLNCDLGESFGQYKIGEQEEILRYITSANIACGFHAGDPSVMQKTVELAVKYDVKIGAHPGLPDLVGFGRREMMITAEEAYNIVVYQVGALQGFVTAACARMQHVKPHGALYNMAAKDRTLAEAIAQAVFDLSPQLILYGLASSELTKAGERLGLRTAHEVFADRNYEANGFLTSRTHKDALITSKEEAVERMLRFVKEGRVKARTGEDIALKAQTICLHGDSPHAVDFARYAHEMLAKQHIKLTSFT